MKDISAPEQHLIELTLAYNIYANHLEIFYP